MPLMTYKSAWRASWATAIASKYAKRMYLPETVVMLPGMETLNALYGWPPASSSKSFHQPSRRLLQPRRGISATWQPPHPVRGAGFGVGPGVGRGERECSSQVLSHSMGVEGRRKLLHRGSELKVREAYLLPGYHEN